jgi:hypothetical protein
MMNPQRIRPKPEAARYVVPAKPPPSSSGANIDAAGCFAPTIAIARVCRCIIANHCAFNITQAFGQSLMV